MRLAQKPGRMSTEFHTLRAALVWCGVCFLGGVPLGLYLDVVLGSVVIASSAALASVAVATYALSRGRVKAAAEANRPPPHRVW